MLNIVSLIVGAVALLGAVIGFIPLLGWFNWLVIPVALVGAGLGFVATGNSGRNLNLFVLVVCIFRLFVGGGIL